MAAGKLQLLFHDTTFLVNFLPSGSLDCLYPTQIAGLFMWGMLASLHISVAHHRIQGCCIGVFSYMSCCWMHSTMQF